MRFNTVRTRPVDTCETAIAEANAPMASVFELPVSRARPAIKIAVIGLGYVGLPVATAFARFYDVTGFDIDRTRIDRLRKGDDWTGEVSAASLAQERLTLTGRSTDLRDANFYIVTVPTPVDIGRRPDFSMLKSACKVIGPHLKRGDIIVFESTVYPGATEEICGPALAAASGLVCGEDFKLAYSPERINPGDKAHPIEKIVKIVSGQDAETTEIVAKTYETIIDAGVHRAASIKVAEAAKVLENTQRDVNIALMNEMSKICGRLGIRTADVLAAAETKWNFLRFRPGLVGGHCIGVDPYYLTAKAEQLGYHPEVILSGRRINDSMGRYVALRTVQMLSAGGCQAASARVGILGITFKENVPDIRNSKVFDIHTALVEHGIKPIVHDPMASAAATKHEYGIELQDLAAADDLDALILAVDHDLYRAIPPELIFRRIRQGGVLIDIKCLIEPQSVRSDLQYWSL